MAKPRMSRSASAAPRSPATMEKRANMSVFFPTAAKILALVYLVMSCVTVKAPNAPEPLACMRRSGITSRSKWASFSRNQTSWSSIGPRGPAVIAFWLSGTGAPAAVVSFFLSLIARSSRCPAARGLSWVGRSVGRVRTRVANPVDLHVRGENALETLHMGWDGAVVEIGALEITHHAALDADAVVVGRGVGVEADAFAAWAEHRD